MKKTSIDFSDNEQRNLALLEIRQQLLQAVSVEGMRGVLADLPKNGLDALASSESIDFPRALSRMKKDEMIAILLDEIIRRATIIKNGEELTVNGVITPLMEAAYNLQNKSEYVAEAREKQRANLQALSDSVVVRVVNWEAVQEKKNPADIPVSQTKIQSEDTIAEKSNCDYSTECEQFESPDAVDSNAVQAFLQDNEANNLPDGVISSFVPRVVEIIPVNDEKVMHWGFKWGNDDFSTLSNQHLLDAGMFLGLKISPSVSREERIKIVSERRDLILKQIPDEETAFCFGAKLPISKRNSRLSALLEMADKEADKKVSNAVFSPEDLQSITRQAFMDTRRFAARFREKAQCYSQFVPVRKQVADCPRQVNYRHL